MIALGDSHIELFKNHVVTTCLVPGATAYGLANEDSITQSKDKFDSFLSINKSNYAIFCLGEVDCNSIAWIKRNDLDWRDYIIEATNRYFQYLKTVPRKVIISSAPLPGVDFYNKPPFSDRRRILRTEVTWNRKTRTLIVDAFNNRLAQLCKENKIPFITFAKETRSPDGMLDKYYSKYVEDGVNIHLDPVKMGSIIADKIDQAISFYED